MSMIKPVLYWSIMFLLCRHAEAQDDSDPVLEYYCQRAAEVSAIADSARETVRYAIDVRTYYHKLGRESMIERTDSALITFWYTGATLDSQQVIEESADLFDDLVLFPPRIFEEDYQFSFFPNDTGGQYLPIGFDTDSLMDGRPTGLAVIDRYDHYPRWLYLYYPFEPNMRRFSRSWVLSPRENGILVPDSVVVVAAKMGILFPEYFRRETVVTGFRILN